MQATITKRHNMICFNPQNIVVFSRLCNDDLSERYGKHMEYVFGFDTRSNLFGSYPLHREHLVHIGDDLEAFAKEKRKLEKDGWVETFSDQEAINKYHNAAIPFAAR